MTNIVQFKSLNSYIMLKLFLVFLLVFSLATPAIAEPSECNTSLDPTSFIGKLLAQPSKVINSIQVNLFGSPLELENKFRAEVVRLTQGRSKNDAYLFFQYINQQLSSKKGPFSWNWPIEKHIELYNEVFFKYYTFDNVHYGNANNVYEFATDTFFTKITSLVENETDLELITKEGTNLPSC